MHYDTLDGSGVIPILFIADSQKSCLSRLDRLGRLILNLSNSGYGGYQILISRFAMKLAFEVNRDAHLCGGGSPFESPRSPFYPTRNRWVAAAGIAVQLSLETAVIPNNLFFWFSTVNC
ncbi:MAG: hypothetical protein DMG44_11390 [Acidobacteria bacterium]|nr:MAG: hypothetical protein DMG44_11390 [Acidobacteriota bacterium]